MVQCLYNGLETKADHHLSLFTKDLLDLSIDQEWFDFIKKLIDIKKDPINKDIIISLVDTTKGEFMIIKNIYKDESYTLGIFNLSTREQLIKSDFLIDGIYTNLLDNKIHFIENNSIKVSKPLILTTRK